MCIVDCKNDYVSSLPLFNVSRVDRRNLNDAKIFMREFLLKNIELLYILRSRAMISGLMLLLKWSGIHIPSWILMPVCSILAVLRVEVYYKERSTGKQIYEVTLIYQDKTLVLRLFMTGNTLMTRKSEPVHVLAPSIWKELIGEDPWNRGWICSTLSDS